MLFRESFLNKNLMFVYNPVPSVRAYVDSEMLSTVLRNLISNSVKFTFPGGNITVEIHEKGDSAEIVIRDDGIGISEGDLQNLFKIDKHISTIGTFGETGSGLGLILCKLFIERNNGQLLVTSERQAGTEFRIILPVSEQPPSITV
jgi:signal transduction histidine kinase